MKLVILDRDGVINYDSEAFIKSPDEWTAIPGSLEAIARLNQAGYAVAIATNQSGIGRGLYDMDALEAIHTKMRRSLAEVGGRVDAIFFCPHVSADGCDCRKPLPGLFSQISEHFGTGLTNVPAIGDSLRDLQAANNAEALPVLVKTGKGERSLERGGLPEGTLVFEDLDAAVRFILS